MGGADKLMRKVVTEQLGPILQQAGISEDPFEFFVDIIKVSCCPLRDVFKNASSS